MVSVTFLVTDSKKLDFRSNGSRFGDVPRLCLMVQVFATQAATFSCKDVLRQIQVWFVATQVEVSSALSRHSNYSLR